MSRSVRLKCWLQLWTFCAGAAHAAVTIVRVCARSSKEIQMRKAPISGSGVATLFESSAPARVIGLSRQWIFLVTPAALDALD